VSGRRTDDRKEIVDAVGWAPVWMGAGGMGAGVKGRRYEGAPVWIGAGADGH
jgi:hypothetical protein